MSKRIYLASSWRNPAQPEAVTQLRAAGHEVYDFRNPTHVYSGERLSGFAWSAIDPGRLSQQSVARVPRFSWLSWLSWLPLFSRFSWSTAAYIKALKHPLAQAGFDADYRAMRWADTFVLLLPCGRSAHLEAGWACGAGREVYIVHPDGEEPELMAKLATAIVATVPDVLALWDAR